MMHSCRFVSPFEYCAQFSARTHHAYLNRVRFLGDMPLPEALVEASFPIHGCSLFLHKDSNTSKICIYMGPCIGPALELGMQSACCLTSITGTNNVAVPKVTFGCADVKAKESTLVVDASRANFEPCNDGVARCAVST